MEETLIGVIKDLAEAIPSCLNKIVSTVLEDEILQGNLLECEKIVHS